MIFPDPIMLMRPAWFWDHSQKSCHFSRDLFICFLRSLCDQFFLFQIRVRVISLLSPELRWHHNKLLFFTVISSVADPWHTGVDPACYFHHWPSRRQQKTNFFEKVFLHIIFVCTFPSFFKDKRKKSHKTVEIKDFLTIFAEWEKDPDPDPYLWLMDPDPDPDPGGPKHVDPVGPDPDPQHWL
jgi:hypothetical protein